MNWVEIEHHTDGTDKRRYFAAVSGFGNVFVPATLAGSEQEIYLASLEDDVRSFRNWRLLYVPAEWLVKAFPHCSELCQQIQGKAYSLHTSQPQQRAPRMAVSAVA